jgi:hypothetical protein
MDDVATTTLAIRSNIGNLSFSGAGDLAKDQNECGGHGIHVEGRDAQVSCRPRSATSAARACRASSLLLGPAEMEPDTGQARDSGGHHGDLRSRAEGGPLSTG